MSAETILLNQLKEETGDKEAVNQRTSPEAAGRHHVAPIETILIVSLHDHRLVARE